jgi:hypothetical protein
MIANVGNFIFYNFKKEKGRRIKQKENTNYNRSFARDRLLLDLDQRVFKTTFVMDDPSAGVIPGYYCQPVIIWIRVRVIGVVVCSNILKGLIYELFDRVSRSKK